VKTALKQIFLVHPPQGVLQEYFKRSQTPEYLKTKISEIDNWRKLAQFIHYEQILLSDESKNFITLSNYVVKVNERGKCQPR